MDFSLRLQILVDCLNSLQSRDILWQIKSYPRKDLQFQKVTIWSLTTSFKYLYGKFGYKLHIMWFDVAIVNAMCWDLCLISP